MVEEVAAIQCVLASTLASTSTPHRLSTALEGANNSCVWVHCATGDCSDLDSP